MNDLLRGTNHKAFSAGAGFTPAPKSAAILRCEASRDMWEKKAISLEAKCAALMNALTDARNVASDANAQLYDMAVRKDTSNALRDAHAASYQLGLLQSAANAVIETKAARCEKCGIQQSIVGRCTRGGCPTVAAGLAEA